jgi:simple sugar transport system permease protein
MTSFAVGVTTGSLLLGFLAGLLVGALVALVVAFSSITLRQSQVAVGFVLALLCRDLAYFLGNPFMGLSGPRLGTLSIPLLREIPMLGRLLFEQNLMVYLSLVLIAAAWLWIFRTRPGLALQSVGERPEAAFVRGIHVPRVRYLYTVLGGALVGLAGPTYSLSVKAGWKGTISGLDGIGWIALAITIFGGWNPLRAAFGAYLFALLQWLGLVLQPSLPGIPSQVLQVAPFPLMILALLLVSLGNADWVARALAVLPDSTRRFVAGGLRSMRALPPAALGTPFEKE